MTKRIILASCLFCFPFFLMAQNFSIIGERINGPFPSSYALHIVDEQRMKLEWTSDVSSSYDEVTYFNYSMEQRDGMTFLVLDADIPKEIQLAVFNNATPWDVGSEILLLAGKIQKQKITSTDLYYFADFYVGYVANPDYNGSHTLLEDIHLRESLGRNYRDVSSSLSEFGRVYDVKDLIYLESESAWVEGVSGDGIGEGFVIENSWDTKWNTLLIINGFISARNPKLYHENGRVKKIKVEGVESGVSKVLDVVDTPHPQTVDITFLPEAEDIRVTIADVYPGTKYKDTAIHYCITYEYSVVPLFP